MVEDDKALGNAIVNDFRSCYYGKVSKRGTEIVSIAKIEMREIKLRRKEDDNEQFFFRMEF